MEKELKQKIRKASNANSLTLLLFYVFIIVFSMFGKYITAIFVSPQSQNFNYIYKLIAYLFQYAVTIPVVLLIFRLVMRKDSERPALMDCLRKPKMPAGWVVKWILISLGMVYAVSYASNVLFTLIQSLMGIELNAADFTADESTLDRVTNILAITILAPVFEELLFRASLFRNAERFGAAPMIIISGITFGLWHANFAQTLYTAALGMFSCFLISKTKSVIPSLILHFCMNFIGGIQSVAIGAVDAERLASEDTLYILEKAGWVMLIMLLALVVIGLALTGIILFIIELVSHRESFRVDNNYPEVSGSKKAFVYITAPVTIIMLAFMLFMTVANALA